MKLTKGCFALETNPRNNIYGLCANQIRVPNVLTNAGWYNSAGERLGRGDISNDDLRNIANNILADEQFFVLTEGDADWNLPSDRDCTCPGRDYVVARCQWMVDGTKAGGTVYRPLSSMKDQPPSNVVLKISKLSFTKISKKDFADLMGASPSPNKPEKLKNPFNSMSEAEILAALDKIKNIAGALNVKPISTSNSSIKPAITNSAIKTKPSKKTSPLYISPPKIKTKP